MQTPEGFAHLSLKDLIPEHLYALPCYYPDGAQHSLVTEIPSTEQGQRVFSQEKIQEAIATFPQAHIRHLHRTEPVDWTTFHPRLINQVLYTRMVDLSLYRYLLGCKMQQQGQVLWKKSLSVDWHTAIKWHYFDATHVEQWLQMETQQLLSAENPDFEGFGAIWGQAMQKLPEDLQREAWYVLLEKLGQGNSLSNFRSPSELNRFVQNTSTMLPMLNALAPPSQFSQPESSNSEEFWLLTEVGYCLSNILIALKANPEKDQAFAVDKAAGHGSALLECQELIRKVLEQNLRVVKQLPQLSRAVFEEAVWDKMGVAPSLPTLSTLRQKLHALRHLQR